MSENLDPNDRLTDEQKLALFDKEMRKKAKGLGVDPDLLNAKISFGPNSNKTSKEQFELAKALGLQLVTDKLREDYMANVHTAQDFEDFLKVFNEQTQSISTIARKVIEAIKSTLPRMGGPGRLPKLNADERKVACDEILYEIRRGASFKEAVRLVSKRSFDLFEKSVSSRTLEYVWRDRAKYVVSENPSKE